MSAEPEVSITVTGEDGKKEDVTTPAEATVTEVATVEPSEAEKSTKKKSEKRKHKHKKSHKSKSSESKEEEDDDDDDNDEKSEKEEEKPAFKYESVKPVFEVCENGRIFKTPGKEDPENHTCYEGHEFELTSFHKFTYCNYCKNILMGVSSQGYMCKTCCLCFHEKCLRKVFAQVDKYFTDLKSKKKDEKDLKSENADEKVLGSENGAEVENPEDIVTAASKEDVEKFRYCKLSACFDPNGLRKHQWVEGNTYLSFNTKDTSCIKCGKEAGSLVSFTDYRCLWCGRLIHSTCLKGDPDFAAVPSPNVDATEGEKMPLIVFANTISGGQCGALVLDGYRRILNPKQIFCLNKEPIGPEKGFDFAYNLGGEYRILACGGDGSIGWVLRGIKARNVKAPLGILPLGTGNDLSKALGWGASFSASDPLDRVLYNVMRSKKVLLDRWIMKVTPIKFEGDDNGSGDNGEPEGPRSVFINNYFSIGTDAEIALQFHEKRQKDPEGFKSPLKNKIVYTFIGATEMFTSNNKLAENIKLEVDGKEIDIKKSGIQCLAFVNLLNMYSGTIMWGTKLSKSEIAKGFVPASYGDGILEILSMKGAFDLAQVSSGLVSPDKVAQGKNIRITFLKNVPYVCEYDGEPYVQKPAVLEISLFEKASLLEVPSK